MKAWGRMGDPMRKGKRLFCLLLAMAVILSFGFAPRAEAKNSKVSYYKIKNSWVGFEKSTGRLTWSDGLNYIPKKIAGKKVTILGKWCYNENKNIKIAKIPSSVKKIEKGAFYGCPKLTKVVLPKGLKLGDIEENRTFWDSNQLKTVVNNSDKKWKQRMQTFQDTLTYLKKKDPQYYVDQVRTFKNQWVPDDETGEHHAYTDEEWEVVKKKAAELVKGCKSDMEKAKAISKWIVGYLHYDTEWMKEFQEWRKTHDEDKETFPRKKYTDAYHLITWKKSEHGGETAMTTCGGYGNLTQALFACAGIPCVHVHREQKEGESIDHVFNVAYVGGKWIWLDNTYSDKTLDYFNCQIAGMSASDHRCDRLNLEYLTDLMKENAGEASAPAQADTLQIKAYTEGETEYVKTEGGYWGINRGKNQIDSFPKEWTGPEVPAEIDGMPVKAIGEYACQWRDGIKSLTLPEGITKIGQGAFQGNRRLETLTLPKSLKEIADYAFRNCDSLETVQYLSGRKNVKHGCFCFRGCYFLHEDFSAAYKRGIFYKQAHEVKLTGDLTKDILAIGRSQLGYHQGNDEEEMHGYNKLGGEYYSEYNYFSGLPDWQWGMKDLVKKSQYPYGYGGWCGNYCEWVLAMAGVPPACHAHCGNLDAVKWKDTVYAGGTYRIKAGDVLHFSAGHYALVTDVDVEGSKVKVKTLNGNPDVDKKTYPLNKKDGSNDESHNYDLDEILPLDTTKLAEVKSFRVSFDADGGTTAVREKTVYEAGFFGLMPKPEKSGYTFDGWYTEKNGKGKKITSYRNVYLDGDITVYAKWKEGAEPAYLDYDSYVSKAPAHSSISDQFARVYITKSTFAYATVKKKAQKATIKKMNGKGKMHFTNTTAGAKKKYIKISAKGVVTIRKGAPKGTYSIHVKVDAYKTVNMTQSTVYIVIK